MSSSWVTVGWGQGLGEEGRTPAAFLGFILKPYAKGLIWVKSLEFIVSVGHHLLILQVVAKAGETGLGHTGSWPALNPLEMGGICSLQSHGYTSALTGTPM